MTLGYGSIASGWGGSDGALPTLSGGTDFFWSVPSDESLFFDVLAARSVGSFVFLSVGFFGSGVSFTGDFSTFAEFEEFFSRPFLVDDDFPGNDDVLVQYSVVLDRPGRAFGFDFRIANAAAVVPVPVPEAASMLLSAMVALGAPATRRRRVGPAS